MSEVVNLSRLRDPWLKFDTIYKLIKENILHCIDKFVKSLATNKFSQLLKWFL